MKAPADTVVITGCGWVTPFAAGDIAHVLRLLPPVGHFPPGAVHLPVPEDVLGNVDDISPEARRERHVLIAAVAVKHALRSAGLPPAALASERVGLAIGCALAGQIGMIDFAEDVRAQSARFVSPIRFPQTVGNYLAGALARAFGIRGPSVTLASGTASGLAAVLEGAAWLRAGNADMVIAGGAEVFTEALAEGLRRSASAVDGSAPFADAACLFVLERSECARARGALILVEMGEGDPAILGLSEGATIENRTGRSLAASGAAGVASAIAAVSGKRP